MAKRIHIVACGLKNFRDFKSKRNVDLFVVLSALRLDLRCPRSGEKRFDKHLFGELLLSLRYLRNPGSYTLGGRLVNYCLIYSTSETFVYLECNLWTTAWITIPPKRRLRLGTATPWWTTAWITVHPKLNIRATAKVDGELLLGLRYFRNTEVRKTDISSGELLLGLPYPRNE